MGRMSGELPIARPADVVFDMAADEPSWNPAMTSVEWLTPPPMAAGTRFVATMGRRLRMTVVITGFDRPHTISSRTRSAMMATEGAVTVRPTGDGTLLSWDWTYTLHGATRLLTPVFALFAARWERGNWERMRDLLEDPDPPPGPPTGSRTSHRH